MRTVEYLRTNIYEHPAKLVARLACLFLITFSIYLFIYSGLMRSLEGLQPDAPAYDFYLWYTAGQLWNEGADPYDYDLFRARLTQLAGEKPLRGGSGYYYPPQATIFFAWLAYLPLEIGYLAFLGLNLACLIASMIMLALILSWYRPLGLVEITLLASLIGTGFGRMNIREGQTGLLACFLILLTFVLARYRQTGFAGVSLAGLSFKPTFVPLYFGYYLLHRSYRLLFTCIFTGIVITFLPLLLTGRPVVETILSWLHMLGFQGSSASIENIDSPSPFTPNSALMSHLTPLVYRLFNAQSTLTSAIAWLIIVSLVGYAAYLIGRSKSSGRAELLDFGLVSALSLICIYHRPYDGFLLFPGLLYIYIHLTNLSDQNAKIKWAILLAGVIGLLIAPIDLTTRLSGLYPALLDSYLWRLIAPFQAWAGVLVVAALLWLKAHHSSSPSGEPA